MATKYEIPEETDEKLLGTLGKEVEMKTSDTFPRFSPANQVIRRRRK